MAKKQNKWDKMSKYFVGIDAGTSIVKSVLFDINGEEIYVSKQKTQVLSPKPNWSEQEYGLCLYSNY